MGLGTSHRLSGMGLGTSRMSGREAGISRMSGRELGTSRRFWSGMELDISRKFEWEPELSISQWFEADKEQVPEHKQFGPGLKLGLKPGLKPDLNQSLKPGLKRILKPGLSQRHRCHLARLQVPNPSHKMEGTAAASAGHTSCCSFENSEKKRFIKTARVERFPENCSGHLQGG